MFHFKIIVKGEGIEGWNNNNNNNNNITREEMEICSTKAPILSFLLREKVSVSSYYCRFNRV